MRKLYSGQAVRFDRMPNSVLEHKERSWFIRVYPLFSKLKPVPLWYKAQGWYVIE